MRQLLLLTTSFPFGRGEDFLTQELPHAQGFDQYIVCACHAPREAAQTKPVPEKMQVLRLQAEESAVPYPALLGKGDLWAELFRLPCQGKAGPGPAHELVFFRKKAEAVYRALCRQALPLLKGDEIVLYSYWLYDAALAAALLAHRLRRMGKRVRLVSRAHGFDAFPERARYGYLPMRRFLLSACDAVRPCSEQAAQAVRAACPAMGGKVSPAYLGTADYGCPGGRRRPEFHLVTCSYLVPVKRISLLVQALGQVDFPLRWTHIGDGPQLEEVRAGAEKLPAHIHWELPGAMDNRALMEYYSREPVSCLVNVSSSEGLPVSLMEAASFGFPALATAVGGTPEALREGQTGFLLPASPSPGQIAGGLERLYRMEEEEYQAMCRNARRLWEERFSAARNFPRFYQEL